MKGCTFVVQQSINELATVCTQVKNTRPCVIIKTEVVPEFVIAAINFP
jgi:hypothetical protein